MMVDEGMPEGPAWKRHRSSLEVQAGFVRSYSPLTAALLEQAIAWLDDPEGRGQALGDREAMANICERLIALLAEDDVEGIDTGWLDDLQPALRLNASLHYYVLKGDPRVAELRPYYRTVEDGRGPDARKPNDEEFARRVFTAAAALGPELFDRARDWHVVSNEPARGLAWLLPAVLVAAETVHLVELGCAVGLNLYAEQRHYDLAWTSSKRLRLGQASDDQFLIRCEGGMPELADFGEAERRGPEVLSRVGCEAYTDKLELDEIVDNLEACVWGDQPRQLERLRQGMEIHRRAHELGLKPAEIVSHELPGDLQDFLTKAVPANAKDPVIAYNTYATAYLSDVNQRAVAREMRSYARTWSLRHKQPWMWVRFEPPRAGTAAPHAGWCQWIVELFSGARHKTIDLGWAHPHMTRAEFGPGLVQLRELRDRR